MNFLLGIAIANASIIVTALLSRVFMKEKLGIPHIIALLLTIAGVILISKPSFIFPTIELLNSEEVKKNLNCTNNTCKNVSTNSNSINSKNDLALNLGIILMIICAIFFGILNIFIRKLCINNVDWAVSSIYPGYFGLPLSIIGSFLLVKFGYFHTNLRDELQDIPIQILFSSLSSLAAIIGTAFLILAFSYEDATKVAISKTSDVIFAFILQLVFLNITVDLLSIVGSFLILSGTVFVLGFKLIENKFEKKSNKGCIKKLLFIKF